MRNKAFLSICALSLIMFISNAAAAPAVLILGKDYEFANKISGLPANLTG